MSTSVTEVPNTDPNQLWSPGKIAMVLEVSLSTVNRLAEEGEFGKPFYIRRSKRYLKREVIAYITRRGDDAETPEAAEYALGRLTSVCSWPSDPDKVGGPFFYHRGIRGLWD